MKFTNRQLEIIQAATKLVGNKGIQNLTTKNLATEMGFSEAALYRHFKNKNVIISSILEYYKDDFKGVMMNILQTENLGIEKLEHIIEFLFSHFVKNPAIIMIIFAETSFQNEKMLSEQVLSILNQKKIVFEQVILKGQEDGSIRKDINKEQLSTIFMGSMRFTVLRWRLSKMGFDLEKEGVVLWKALHKILKQ